MKPLFFFALSLIFFSSAVAQTQYPVKILKSSRDTVLLSKSLTFNDTNSKFLFDNGHGKVYQSLIDNMRILAPNYRSKMPTAFPHFGSEMPVRKMVPKTLDTPDIHFLPKVPPSR